MEVLVMDTEGFNPAMKAMRLSFNSERKKNLDFIESKYQSLYTEDYELVRNLIKKGDSHAKVMRMVTVWLDITAPRYWWQEMATYGVGTVTMSESTMHTIMKKELDSENFEGGMPEEILCYLNDHIKRKDFMAIKATLPESFLQRRVVCTNYQTLRHIYFDRRNHKLPEWKYFIDRILWSLPFSDLITIEPDKNQ
jgi:hypothetical protein